MDQKIVHFSHNHPLVFKEQEHDEEIDCSACEQPISASSPVFHCSRCNYVLHKSCTKLPHKIKHPFHPEHPLTLLPIAPYYNGLGYICNSCREVFDGFVYHCAHCEYDLDITCASKYHPDDGHSHEFTSLDDDDVDADSDDDDDDDDDSFVCYACGDEATKGSGCICTVCRIKVHSSCSKLPQIVRTKHHHHSLSLTYSLFGVFGLMDEDDMRCGACNGKLSSSFGGYFCSICKFATHLKCSKKQTEDFEAVTEDDETEHVSDSEKSHEESPKTVHGHDQSHHDLDLSKLLDHEHLLRFMEELSLQCADKLCDACVQPITAPLFSCSESDCGFLIHQSCTELPRKKQHKLHPHPLNLLPKAPPYDGIYRCDGCNFLGNGFVYRCDECQFDLDVFCGSLMDKIQHDSHKHTLLLQRTSIEKECRGCNNPSKHMFVCDVCDDFAIDFGCATLPSKVWHMYDKHPLSLRYSVEGDLREHKCGICKEKRSNQKQWFYYCDDCDFGAHTWCVLDKSRHVKFGGTYLYDVLHSHPLALVDKKGTKHPPPCEACGEGCKSWTLECGQCSRYFHREGNCFWGKFKESAKFLALSETMRHKYAANVLAATPNVTNN